MPAAAKKNEPGPKGDAKKNAHGLVIGEPVPITNIQKTGVLRFHAKNPDTKIAELADYVEVKPGETVLVPWRIWENYEARADVEAHDRVHFVVGGLKPGEEMKTPTAQQMALNLRMREVERREAEAASYEAKLEQTRTELEALKEQISKGH